MTTDQDLQSRSTPELLKTLSAQVTTLVHQEMELAKVELVGKTKKFGLGAGIFGASGIVGGLAGVILVAAAIAGIATALSVWLSILIVGAFLAVVAGVLAATGVSELAEGGSPIPQEALDSTKEDVAWLKTQAKSTKP